MGSASSVLSTVKSPSFITGVGLGLGIAAGYINFFQKQISDAIPTDNTDNDSAVCSSEDDDSDYSDVDMSKEMKMVLVVRQDLKMGKGKAAAQCCHATLAAYKSARRKCPEVLRSWEVSGQPKVTVKCDTEDDLLILLTQARSLGLVSSVISDAGRTQIAPGSKTVLAVGPGPADLVDQRNGFIPSK
jgi:PTH2 family peptidyl-tRNA hydrolase